MLAIAPHPKLKQPSVREAPIILRAVSAVEPEALPRSGCACGGGCPRCQTASGRLDGLQVSRPGDQLERDADRIAESVMSLPPAPLNPHRAAGATPAGRSEAPVAPAGNAHLLQRQTTEDEFTLPPEPEEEEEPDEAGLMLARAASSDAPQSPASNAGLRALRAGGGSALPPATRASFEHRFGYDFGGVQVHTGSEADSLARSLGARAVTLGSQIAFRAGEYAPDQPAGQRLLAHELTHVVQQGAARSAAGELAVRPTAHVQPMLLRKACNFFVYDSTENTKLGTAWEVGATLRATGSRGGYVIGSSDTIEYMLSRILRNYEAKDCDCIEEIQFWSHGSPGDSMYISKTEDELTVADFQIPGLDKFERTPGFFESVRDTPYAEAWQKWYDGLSWRHQLLLRVRDRLCGPDSEIYYRSCSAFQGKEGMEFAKASATFWRSKVIGHTKIIGVTQPGKHVLSPGQEPYWPETEGETTEMKKRGSKPKKD